MTGPPEQLLGQCDGVFPDCADGRAADGPAAIGMKVDYEIPMKSLFYIDVHPPLATRDGMCRPAHRAEPRGAIGDRNALASREPMLRRSFLQMAYVLVPFLIAEKPTQAESRLKSAIDYGRPTVPSTLTCKASGNIRILWRVPTARVHCVTNKGIEVEQEGTIVRLANLYSQASWSMKLEVRATAPSVWRPMICIPAISRCFK